jgi:hypothetical protein
LYVYERAPHGLYVFKQALTAPNSNSYDYLALQPTALSMTDGYIVAGSSNADDLGNGKYGHGRAFLWSYKALPNADGQLVSQWQSSNTFEITTSQAEAYDYFGTAVHV